MTTLFRTKYAGKIKVKLEVFDGGTQLNDGELKENIVDI